MDLRDFQTTESPNASVSRDQTCNFAAVCATLRKSSFLSRRLAAAMVRANLEARAANHNFNTWYLQVSSQFRDARFHCGLAASPLTITRRALPHTLLYFLIQVLQRMLDQFWDTAEQNEYVMRCARANGRCPPSIIAALFYYECKALNPCISRKSLGSKKQRLEAGSEAVASCGDASLARALRDAFWQTFAENVMLHLVWPAVWQGVIRFAPIANKDNPDWWAEGVLPILNDPAVWSLHWLGGKKMARQSWYHVCRVLDTYDFPPVLRLLPFTQKTVPEFLEAAGYRKAPADEDVAARRVVPAARSTAASSASSGSAPTSVPVRGAVAAASALKRSAGFECHSALPLAAAAPPSESRIEPARQQSDFARRFAYSEFDQQVRRIIASAQWCWLSDRSVCTTIGRAFQVYLGTNEFSREALDPKAVVAELRLTVEYFSQENLFPRWVLEPNERFVRQLPENYDAYEDFGNENWEALVNLMNLSSVIPSVHGQEIFNAASNAVYGDRLNRSSVGSYNFRGNVVERLLTYLLCESELEGLALVTPVAGQ